MAAKKKKKIPNTFFPKKNIVIPKTGTMPCKEYFSSWIRINKFLDFVMKIVSQIEATSHHAHQALVDTARSEEERNDLIKQWESRTGPVDELKKHRQFLMEIILVRHIENYLNYLSGLLMEIFVQRPETLRSSDKIELEIALKHDSISDLVKTVAEKKVESLSYSSFTDLQDFFEQRFGLELFKSDSLQEIIEAIEIRNISVHNRCIINQRFIKKTNMPEDKLGQRRGLGISYLEKLVPMLGDSVKRLDGEARRNLKVKGARFTIKDDNDF